MAWAEPATCGRLLEIIPKRHDGFGDRRRDAALEIVRGQQPFLFGVRQVAHFDQHRRHVRAGKVAHRRALKGDRRHARYRAQLLIEDAGKRVRAVEVRGLRQLPLDQRKLASAAAEYLAALRDRPAIVAARLRRTDPGSA